MEEEEVMLKFSRSVVKNRNISNHQVVVESGSLPGTAALIIAVTTL